MIDLWRALACLSVVLFHACQNIRDSHPALIFIAEVFGQNGPRLAAFFVISGFCLASSLERHAASRIKPLVFWRRRIARIYPVYWAALSLAILLALAATPFNGLAPATAFPPSLLAWLADLSLTSLWLGTEPRLLVSWTLNYEVGFYVVVGAALFFDRVSTRIAYYLGITVLCHIPAARDWFPLLGIWSQFACGIAACCALSPSLTRGVRIAAASYPAALTVLSLSSSTIHAAFAPVIALCMIASVGLEYRLPRAPARLLAIGAASFSIYLVHVPFMSPLLNLLRRWVAVDGWIFVVDWSLHLIVAVLAGLLFHRYVEKPLVQGGRGRHAPQPDPSRTLEAKKTTARPA